MSRYVDDFALFSLKLFLLRRLHHVFFHLLPEWCGAIGAVVGFQLYIGNFYLVVRQEGDDDVAILLDKDGCYTLRDDAQLLGGTPREVDDASADVWTTIGDSDHDAAAVGWIVDLQLGAEGVGEVGTGQTVAMQAFATGGLAPMEFLGIERGLAFLSTLSAQK